MDTINLKRWLIALFLGAVLVFSVGIDRIPTLDRDEARFAQASKQMAETGDWVDIRFQDGTRYKKPVGIYWAQTMAAHVTGTVGGDDIWVYRLPSLLAASLACIALVWAGIPLVGSRWALIAGFMLASTFVLHGEARIAKTDAALLACIITAMGALARVWINRTVSFGMAALFWTALGLGFLIKGPLVLLPVLGAILWVSVFERGLRWANALRPLLGVLWFLAIAAPWYILIIIQSEGAFLDESLGRDLTAKIQSGQEDHGAPFGTYFLAFWVSAWPWTLLAPLGGIAAWRMRKRPEMAFLLGWVIPMWIMLELVPTKLIHYPMPFYPAILLAIAFGLKEYGLPKGLTRHIGAAVWTFGILLIGALVIWAPIEHGNGLVPLAVLIALAALIIGVVGVVSLYRDQVMQTIFAIGGSAVVMIWALFAFTLPTLSNLLITPKLDAHSGCFSGQIYLTQFHEPSAVFELGTDIVLASEEEAKAALEVNPNAIAWLPSTDSPIMVTGRNYSNWRKISLGLYQAPGVPVEAPICD